MVTIAIIAVIAGCDGAPGGSGGDSPDLQPPCAPSDEICNGLDDDCNGVVDDPAAVAGDCLEARGPGFACSADRRQCDCATQCAMTCVDPASDSAHCGGCDVHCGAGQACVAGQCAAVMEQTFVVSRILLPGRQTEFAIDLDGDGVADNQLASMLAEVRSLNQFPAAPSRPGVEPRIDPQGNTDHMVSQGRYLLLLSLSRRAALPDDFAHLTVSVGVAAAGGVAPRFDGSDSFTIDHQKTLGTLTGRLAAGREGGAEVLIFDSASPVTTPAPVTLPIGLPVLAADNPEVPLAELALEGAHATLVLPAAPGQAVKPHGALQGSLDGERLFTVGELEPMLPFLSARCDRWPDCYNDIDNGAPAGSKDATAIAGDGVVTLSELIDSTWYQTWFKPDIDLGTALGVYWPQPIAFSARHYSAGVGFTAVEAKVQ